MNIGRNSLYNLAGSVAPMAVSLLTVPAFLRLIGTPQYGVLTIVWLFLGYFGVFDPGLSRATTYHMAKLREEDSVERQRLFWTAICINSAFGVLGGLALFQVAQPMFTRFINMPEEMRPAVLQSLPWLAAAIPVGTIAGVVSGTLEGLGKFALVNAINFAGTLAFQLIPLAIAAWMTRDLRTIIAATVLARLGTAFIFLGFAWFHCKAGRPRFASMAASKELFGYGSWISVTNLIVPFVITLDKFLIGTYLNVAYVAIYSIPDNLTRRLLIIPASLSRSLFPRFSSENKPTAVLFEKSFFFLLAIMTPVCVAAIFGMHLFLRLWVGQTIADQATPVGIILAASIFLNGLAQLPATYLQATGRPNLNAKFHLLEIGPHILFLFVGIHYLKLIGAASAMLVVCGLDATLLFRASNLKLEKIPEFRMAILFIVASIVLQRLLNPNSWQSYIPFVALLCSCLVVFRKSVPELNRRLKAVFDRSPIPHSVR